MDFTNAYKKLNKAQRQAVDCYDGPMLVIAGPGTGKTQLLSTRVANILKQTDTLPQNILCLTFTENGANNMRERLTQQIGQDAYRVQIGTYHAFGSEIISRYPEYFTNFYLQNTVDDLGRFEIIKTIVDKLPFNSPLKHTQHYPSELLSIISDIKQATLNAQDLRDIAEDNQHYYDTINQIVLSIFSDFTSMPRKLDLAVSYFMRLHTEVLKLPASKYKQPFASLQKLLIESLYQAILDSTELKTKPLTTWKNLWLEKNSDNKFILAGKRTSDTLFALASVLDEYNNSLRTQNLYDYDDMILQAINLLQTNDDLRFSLQEKYLYILLDEFQDTNKAQAKLIYLLADNPVNEGRPNIMAVGDDDQAIFEFQGANISNMLDFAKRFTNTTIINLTENFRSHKDILQTAQNVAEQIDSRLSDHFPEVSKKITAANKKLPKNSIISRNDFLSPPAQYSWVTNRIKKLIASGVTPKEIAVLSPRHTSLESLVVFLNNSTIPVHYEKRDNVLDSNIVQQLISMTRLLLALGQQDEATASALWPEILSYDFMNIPALTIWQLSWQASNPKDRIYWSQLLINDPSLKPVALFMKTLSESAQTETLETILDYLIGSQPLNINDPDVLSYTSPLKAFYLSENSSTQETNKLYEMLSNLTVLRSRLRDHQASSNKTLKITDFINFVDLYSQSGATLLNTNPYIQNKNSVQLMTVFKAKGLEFEHVFIIDAKDDTWGQSSRGNSSKISLPMNLQSVQHKRATADEKLRILFVAITRAKFGLYITNTLSNYSGKPTKRLEYLAEQEQADGQFKSLILPNSKQAIVFDDHDSPSLETLELSWRTKHFEIATHQPEMQDLLSEKLEKYRLSPTHLNSFLDVEYSGPELFFINTILQFPQAPSTATSFGNAVHKTLEWLQNETNQSSKLPSLDKTLKHYRSVLGSQHLSIPVFDELLAKGELSLRAYLNQRFAMFQPGFKSEYDFKYENLAYQDVRLNGKIDKIIIDRSNKTLEIIDYKTGKPYSKWESSSKLHGYKLQLYFYRLLIEKSIEFNDYQIIDERLEFVEPDQDGKIHTLTLKFDEKEYERVKQLIVVIWRHIMALDFPDTSKFKADVTGIKQLENSLLANK